MNARVQPIEVLPGQYLCPLDVFFGITETAWFGVDTGDVNDLFVGGQSIWLGGAAGGIAFGSFCPTSITLRISGFMRVLSPGEDDIKLYVNDAVVWSTAADTTAGQAWFTHYFGMPTADPAELYPYYEGTLGSEQLYHEITIPLTVSGCGNVIKLSGGESNSSFGAASWEAKIVAIS